jgi:hypothetical protein
VTYEGYEFIAQEVKGLRISKIQVRKIAASEHAKEGGQELDTVATMALQEPEDSMEDESVTASEIEDAGQNLDAATEEVQVQQQVKERGAE